MANKYFYFVEGECEQAFINELKKKKNQKSNQERLKFLMLLISF